jgi:hypothetical protein
MKRLALALLFLSAFPLHAWTRAGDLAIAEKSAELAPPDLRLIIERFHDDYVTGMERAAAGTPPANLRARIEAETNAVVKLIRANQPMSQVVQRLGILSHLVGDANNPVGFAEEDAETRQDFEAYFERRLPRFALVFYGIDRNFQLAPYLDGVFARSTKFMPLMDEEYGRGTGAEFDDRSTAFGVASLSYSHAVTDTANLYYFIWKQAGGDVRRVPRSSVVMNGSN